MSLIKKVINRCRLQRALDKSDDGARAALPSCHVHSVWGQSQPVLCGPHAQSGFDIFENIYLFIYL